MNRSSISLEKGPSSVVLKRASLKDQVLEVIKQRMIAGEIRPGQIYSASGLATELGTSNAPVREAMLTLVDQGAMTVAPNRGFLVVHLTEKDLDEITEMRTLLEVPAMERLAGMNIAHHEAELRRYADVCRESAAAGEVTAFLTADREFHLSALALLDNGRLLETVSRLRDQTRLYGLTRLAEQDRLCASAEEHFALLDAILAGNQPEAGRVMAGHLAHVRREWADREMAGDPSSVSDVAPGQRASQ